MNLYTSTVVTSIIPLSRSSIIDIIPNVYLIFLDKILLNIFLELQFMDFLYQSDRFIK